MPGSRLNRRDTETGMRRKTICTGILAILMAAFAVVSILNPDAFKTNPFLTAYSANGPSALCIGPDQTLYIVDNSKKDITAVDIQGSVVDQFSLETDGIGYIDSICADEEGRSLYLSVIEVSSGTRIGKESVLRYDLEHKTADTVFSVAYDKNDAPYQYGNIAAMRVFGGSVYLAEKNKEEGLTFAKLEGDGSRKELAKYKPEQGHVSQAVILSADGGVAFSTREGKIFTASGGAVKAIYDSAQQTGGDFVSIPWKLAADEKGNIYYSDLGLRTVVSLPGMSSAANVDNAIIYTVSVRGDTVYATDYSSIYVGKNGGQLQPDERVYRFPVATVLLRLAIWFCAVAAALLFLWFAFLLLRFMFHRLTKKNTRMLLLCLSVSVVITVCISVLTCSYVKAREIGWADNMLGQTGFAMQCYLSQNIGDFEDIDALSDYKTKEYADLQFFLDSLIYASYQGNENGSADGNPMYYILYKNVGGVVCSVMDFEDSMCALHPLADYAGSEYEKVGVTGKASGLIGEESAYGDWEFKVFPIMSNDPVYADTEGTGEIAGFIEVGINNEGLAQVLKNLVLKIVTEIAFFVVLFIMILVEGFKGYAYLKSHRSTREGRLLRTDEEEPYGYIRFITLFVFLCDAMQESFFAVAAGDLGAASLGVSSEMGGAIPISLQLFVCAMFAVLSGRMLRRRPLPRLLAAGFGVNVAGFAVCAYAIASSYPMLLLGKALIGAGMGICINMANVSASAVTDEENRNCAFAELNAGILAGATIGFAAGSYIAHAAGYAVLYLTGAALLAAAALFSLRCVPRVRTVAMGENKITDLRFVFDKRVLGFLFCTLLPFLVLINFREYFFVRFASQNGYSEDQLGKLFLFCGLVIIYLGPVISKYVTRLVGNRLMVLFASGLFAAALSLFLISPGMPAAVTGLFLVSLGISFGYTAQSNYYTGLPATAHADDASRMGVYLLFDNIGQTIGPIVFGWALTAGNTQGILIICIGFVALTFLFALSAFVRRRQA